MEIIVNEYLTWERAEQANDCPEPMPCSKFFPEWWRNLKGDLRSYLPESGEHANHTARMCLGLRGVSQLGYTLPLTADMDNFFPASATKHWRYGWLLQEMLHGSCWAEKNNDDYVWGQPRIVAWPWRAKMAPGWRMMVNDYPLAWSRDWHNFSGYVEASHSSSLWGWEEEMDPDYNYYNLETVLIMRNCEMKIPTDTAVCSFVPVYEPGYIPKQSRGYPF